MNAGAFARLVRKAVLHGGSVLKLEITCWTGPHHHHKVSKTIVDGRQCLQGSKLRQLKWSDLGFSVSASM